MCLFWLDIHYRCIRPNKLITEVYNLNNKTTLYILVPVFFDFSLTVKAAPHECVIRIGQP